jgi:hypothetical protein
MTIIKVIKLMQTHVAKNMDNTHDQNTTSGLEHEKVYQKD